MTTLLSPSISTSGNLSVAGWRRVLARPWESTQGCIFLLVLWSVLLFFYGLGAGDLWRTEGLRAIIAQEMLRTGNWIVPTLYGEPIFTKPPGMYLAVVLCSWPFGAVTDWTARLPSALAGIATVFVFFAFCKRYLGLRGGLVAALILPMSAMWLDKVPTAEIDMLQVFWVTASILCFLRALEEEEKRQGLKNPNTPCHPVTLSPCHPVNFWWYGTTLAMAGGVLTKWTAPAFLYAAALPLLWWRGQLRLLFCRHHLLGLVMAATICLAWIGAAVSLTGWEIFYETVKREGLSRLVPNYDRPYRFGEAFFHPCKLILTTLPWSLVALLTLRPSFYRSWDERGRFLLQAFHCWTWPNVLVWTYMAEHTPRHSFPLFPGIAGLAAMGWLALYETAREKNKQKKSANRPKQFLLLSLLIWMLIKVVFVETIIPTRSVHRRPREKGELLASLVPLGKILYLFRLKDEGVMFYYGRPAHRLRSWEEIPREKGPVYCIIAQGDWDNRDLDRPMEVVQRLEDEQGAPMWLIRVSLSRSPQESG